MQNTDATELPHQKLKYISKTGKRLVPFADHCHNLLSYYPQKGVTTWFYSNGNYEPRLKTSKVKQQRVCGKNVNETHRGSKANCEKPDGIAPHTHIMVHKTHTYIYERRHTYA